MKSFVKGRLISLLAIGLFFLFMAISGLIKIWTPRSALMSLKGTVQSCETYSSTVKSSSRFGSGSESEKAELVFYLNEFDYRFIMSENIGDEKRYAPFENIRHRLKNADSATVWIRASEKNNSEPQIFQIDADSSIVLDFDTMRFQDRFLYMFLLIAGIACVILSVHLLAPRFFKRKKQQ